MTKKVNFLFISLAFIVVSLITSCNTKKCGGCGSENNYLLAISNPMTSIDMQNEGSILFIEDTSAAYQQLVIRGPIGHVEAINRDASDNNYEVDFVKCVGDGCPNLDLGIAMEDMDFLDKITLSSSGSIVSDDIVINIEKMHFEVTGSGRINFPTTNIDTLIVTLSGSGDISIEGTGNIVTIEQTGSGDISLSNFSAKEVTVSVSGSGSTTIKVSDDINATINGSGDVNYIGSPNTDDVTFGTGATGQLIKIG